MRHRSGNTNTGPAHNRFKHGMTGTPTYKSWQGMHRRCYCEVSVDYKNYGARGITVDPRWHVFENFLEDMGIRPEGKNTVERLDNNKSYGPDNCCWANRTTQSRSRRYVRLSAELAKAIRDDRALGLTCVALAGKYGISPSHALRVAKGTSWADDPSLIGQPVRRVA